jgi:hypothetical protein
MKKIFLICCLSFFAISACSQDSTAVPEKLTVTGYIKNLETLNFDKDFKELVSGNLIHNRINFKWKPSNGFTTVAELRNRLYWGEEVKLSPGFVSLLRNKSEYLDMQKAWIKDKSLVLHTNVERLYFDYQNSKLNIRIGRQRINWGLATTWNPNDIFNVYNLLDFDYEERPGVDAGKLKYIYNDFFNVECAYANTGQKDGDIAALKCALNKWSYDIQFIAGWYNNQAAFGAGWAGNIKDAGFKGEVQYFVGNTDLSRHLNLTFECDYMFKKSWYLNAGFLFNDRGIFNPLSKRIIINPGSSPENLMPTRWNAIVTTAKQFSPLLSANMSVLYTPGTNLLVFLPSLQYDIATNLDLNLIWQSFFAELNRSFEGVSNHYYLRLKWSF